MSALGSLELVKAGGVGLRNNNYRQVRDKILMHDDLGATENIGTLLASQKGAIMSIDGAWRLGGQNN